jgi:hypothetical protein
MDSEILCRFWLKSNKEIFERVKKLVWTEREGRDLRAQCLFIFNLLESISDKWKTMSYDQHLMLFPNIGSEIVYLFLFERS